jgi:SmpA / OmlA family
MNIHTIRRSFLVSLFALFVLSACGGGSPATLTQENLDKIKPDMSSQEVKSILGEPTDSKSEPIPIVGGTKTTYVYSNKEDRVVIILKNDNVQTKEGHFGNGQ